MKTIWNSNSCIEHSHTYSFMYCLWLFSHSSSRTEYLWQKPCTLQSLKFALLLFTEKFTNSWAKGGKEAMSQITLMETN